MKQFMLAMTAAGLMLAATAANAAILQATVTPAGAIALIGSGATVVDFEGYAEGDYPLISNAGLTIVPNNGHAFVDSQYAGQYNNFGQRSLHNCYCADSFGSLTFNLASPVNGFGFFFGASDIAWTFSTYDPDGNLLDSLAIGPTNASNAGDFYYTLDTIGSATLRGDSSDYIFIDHVVFGAVPEPAAWALMIAGFGMIGGALRRQRLAIA